MFDTLVISCTMYLGLFIELGPVVSLPPGVVLARKHTAEENRLNFAVAHRKAPPSSQPVLGLRDMTHPTIGAQRNTRPGLDQYEGPDEADND